MLKGVDVDELQHALSGVVLESAEANKERSRVIHDTWATRPGGTMVTLQGGQRSHDVTVTAWDAGRGTPASAASKNVVRVIDL